jgi:hypothetical protein
MSWENRGRQRLYTRSQWSNGKTIRTYVGTGPAAEEAYAADLALRADRLAGIATRKAEAEEHQQADVLLREHQALVDLLVKASLLTAGYYNHDRVWRPRRRT